jgi:hypothetical protein
MVRLFYSPLDIQMILKDKQGYLLSNFKVLDAEGNELKYITMLNLETGQAERRNPKPVLKSLPIEPINLVGCSLYYNTYNLDKGEYEWKKQMDIPGELPVPPMMSEEYALSLLLQTNTGGIKPPASRREYVMSCFAHPLQRIQSSENADLTISAGDFLSSVGHMVTALLLRHNKFAVDSMRQLPY